MTSVSDVKVKQSKQIDSTIRKEKYLVYVYNIFKQFSELKYKKATLKDDEALITVDFSRNYGNKQAREVQAAYFGHDTFTIYTAACYWKDGEQVNNEPVAIVSNEANHDRNVAFSCNQLLIKSIQEVKPALKTLYIWSDGCDTTVQISFCLQIFVLQSTGDQDLLGLQ